MKRKISLFVVALLLVTMMISTFAYAATTGGMKKIDAWFGDIKLMVNGSQVQSDAQPFMYNNTTYVPLRLISEALGQKVGWDQNTYTVSVTGNTADVESLKAQIASQQQQLAEKDAKIAELEAQLEGKDEENQGDASKLEDYLDEEYSTWNDVELGFDVSGDADAFELTISVDLSEYGDEWEDIDNSDVEDLLNDIYDYVKDEYPDAEISGKLVDSDSDDTLADFELSDGTLDVNF